LQQKIKRIMATIRAFRPLRPNPLCADQLVFTKPQAESVAGESHLLPPLKTLLETGARQRPETPEGQEQAYRDIRDTLQSLLDDGRLYREQTPGIYVYEVRHAKYRQTGIWVQTALSDYTGGRIRVHELTFADSVRRIRNYRENTALEGSPILLTYAPQVAINRLIAAVKAGQQDVSYGNRQGIHRLWKINDLSMQRNLIRAFAAIPSVYLADGHHRLEAASSSGFDHISSLYMAADQLRIEPYDRIVLPGEPVRKSALFGYLLKYFNLREATGNFAVRPAIPGNFGMQIDNQWFHMHVKEETLRPDAMVLQEQLLASFFGIADPRTDTRLQCAGGEKALEELGALVQAHPAAIAFTLCPLTVAQLIAVADAGLVLPPKSTWIVPKVPYGLLINRLSINA
jgi:uncharacterized protein (DUF1015 family)